MAYTVSTDFLALLRDTVDGSRVERMPGLDYITAALARAGLFNVSVSLTAPTSNQAKTVWFQPAQPSWSAEGTVYLWNPATSEYEPATPDLWILLLASPVLSTYSFQKVTGATGAVAAATSMLAVQRAGPTATTLTLPDVNARPAQLPLQVTDWSTGIAQHVITLQPAAGQTFMSYSVPTFQLFSTPQQLAGVTLYPVPDLNGWAIAP